MALWRNTTFAAPSLKLWSVSHKASVVKGRNSATEELKFINPCAFTSLYRYTFFSNFARLK
jgi:hypothetical protein